MSYIFRAPYYAGRDTAKTGQSPVIARLPAPRRNPPVGNDRAGFRFEPRVVVFGQEQLTKTDVTTFSEGRLQKSRSVTFGCYVCLAQHQRACRSDTGNFSPIIPEGMDYGKTQVGRRRT